MNVCVLGAQEVGTSSEKNKQQVQLVQGRGKEEGQGVRHMGNFCGTVREGGAGSCGGLLPPALPSSLLSVFSVSSLQCHDVLGGSWGPGAKVSKSKKWAGNDTFN